MENDIIKSIVKKMQEELKDSERQANSFHMLWIKEEKRMIQLKESINAFNEYLERENEQKQPGKANYCINPASS